jgi:transposase-like protein
MKYMLCLVTRIQGKNHNIHMASRFFKNVAQFRYLEMIVTDQNLINEKIKKQVKLEQYLVPFSSYLYVILSAI